MREQGDDSTSVPSLARHEVWARALWAAIDAVEQTGLDVSPVYDGLSFDARSVRKLRRVDWDQYCLVIERLETVAGGSLAIQQLLADSYHLAVPELATLTSALISPAALIRFVVEVVNPIVLSPVETRFQDLGGDRVEVGFRLRAGVRPCLALFSGTIGAIRGLPCHLGLPPAEVIAEVSPVHGTYQLKLPPSKTVVARMSRARHSMRGVLERLVVRLVLGRAEDGEPVWATFGLAGEDDLEGRLALAAQRLQLSPRQAEVLGHLAQGKANKEIAAALGCAEHTVETHVTQLLRRAGADSRARLISWFWSGR